VIPAAGAVWREAEQLREKGRLEDAARILIAAVEANTENAAAWRSLALTFHSMGHPDASLCLERALRDAPSDIDLVLAAAERANGEGRHRDALAVCQEALRMGANASLLHFALGVARYGLGHRAEAASAFRDAARRDPLLAPARVNHAIALLDLGQAGPALRAVAVAAALDPWNREALTVLGRALNALGAELQALALLRRAIRIDPYGASLWRTMVNAFSRLKRWDEAAEAGRRALALAPGGADDWFNTATMLRDLDRWADAMRLWRRALTLVPTHVPSLDALGFALGRLGQGGAAEVCHRVALALDPSCPRTLVDLSRLRSEEQAERFLLRAASVAPADAAARHELALIQLKRGALREGWEGYSFRFAALGYRDRPMPVPRWNGESLAGRTVLVWREQGIGDEMLFASCLDDLVRLGGRAVFECSPRLSGLFSRSFPAIRVIPEGTPLDENVDFHVPLGELPRLLRPGLASFPARPAWLTADPVRRRLWRARLDTLGPGLRIGIGWRSGMGGLLRDGYYTDLADWGAVFALPGTIFVCLQYGDCAEEIARAQARFGITIHTWPDLDLKNDLEGTAALMAGLDVVLSTATAVSEMAGALGVPSARLGQRSWTQLGTHVRPWVPAMMVITPEPDKGMESTPELAARWLTAMRDTARTTVSPSAPPEPDAERPFDNAVALYRQGRHGEAEKQIRAALALRPAWSRALHLAGILRRRLGNDGGGALALFHAARSDPGNADVLAALAVAFAAGGQSGNALAACHRSLVLDPAQPLVWKEAATAGHELEHREEALAAAYRAVRLTPLSVEAVALLGNMLRQADRRNEAASAFRRAVVLMPGLAAAWSGFGAAVLYADVPNAAAALNRAILADPALPEIWTNRGFLRFRRGDRIGARADYEKAIALDGRSAGARYNLSSLLLEDGELPRGWAEHDWRFGTPDSRADLRRFRVPAWRGQSLAGQRLLIWREQGIGDELLFSSCYADAVARAGHAVIECDRRLVSLFQRSFPAATVRAETVDPADIDAHIPAGSLPRMLRGALSRFPAGSGWLKPDPTLVERWRDRLAALPSGLKVGIAWRSGLMTTERKGAYVGLDDWAAVFATPGTVFVNLQYGTVEDEVRAAEARFGITIHRWADLDLKDDFENAAALTAALDLTIAPATATGELAGALGVPTWRFCPRDWTRLGTAVRPWYPAMRLFLPHPGEGLAGTLPRIAKALRTLAVSLPPPADPERDLERAVAAHRAGRRDEAAAAYGAVLMARPRQPVALHLSGLLAHEDGKTEAAEERIAAALAAEPVYPAAWCSLGIVRLAKGDAERAAAALRRSAALRPNDAGALTTLGNARLALADWTGAERVHRWACRLVPDLPEANDNRGVALQRLGRDGEAEAAHRHAIALAPAQAAFRANLAISLRRQGQGVAARGETERALALAPALADAAANLARLARDQGRDGDARRWNERALALDPGLAAARLNLGLLDLSAGNLAAGWAGYAHRFGASETAWAAPRLTMPEWQGEDLPDGRLLVWREQGIGDEMLFSSVLADAARRVGSLIFACEPRLVSLFRRSFPGIDVRGGTGEGIEADRHCAIGSLPRFLRPRLSSFGGMPGWLTADPGRAEDFRRRLDIEGPGLRIGIGWRSGLMTGDRRPSYLDLGDMAPLLTLPGVTAVSLQYGAGEAEIGPVEERLGVRLHRWDDLDLKDDLDGVAALMSTLGLVVTTATSVGELAGALGVPVWRLSLDVDWSTLGTRVRPWFPAMRVWPSGNDEMAALPGRLSRELARLHAV
jgi:tetratricopeptide (TPR) repeat protein/ADP-heptose:LPS heptosyltransferase